MHDIKYLVLIYLVLAMITSPVLATTEQIDREIQYSPYPKYFAPTQNKCEPILLNSLTSDYKDKINIVVIGYGFSSDFIAKYEASQKFSISMGLFFRTQPLSSRRYDFNIWYHNMIGINPDNWDAPSKYISAAKECPANIVIVLSAADIRSLTSVGYTTYVAAYNDNNIVLHELGGHAVGGLIDEYGYTGQQIKPINCDDNPTCLKFQSIPGYNSSGCTLGCSGIYNYRSKLSTTMKNPADTDFGIVNRYIINKRIDYMLQANIKPIVPPNSPNTLQLFQNAVASLLNNLKEWICINTGQWCI